MQARFRSDKENVLSSIDVSADFPANVENLVRQLTGVAASFVERNIVRQ